MWYQIMDEAVICPRCGCPQSGYYKRENNVNNTRPLSVSERARRDRIKNQRRLQQQKQEEKQKRLEQNKGYVLKKWWFWVVLIALLLIIDNGFFTFFVLICVFVIWGLERYKRQNGNKVSQGSQVFQETPIIKEQENSSQGISSSKEKMYSNISNSLVMSKLEMFNAIKVGMSYEEVVGILGRSGIPIQTRTGKGIEIRSKNVVCPNCGGSYNSVDDGICPFCGAINIKDTVTLKDDFIQEEYVWYFETNEIYIKVVFKNNKLITKVQQGIYC